MKIISLRSTISVRSLEIRNEKGIAVFILLFQVITIPWAYAILWVLNWEKVLVSVNPAWISALGGVTSAVISILTFRKNNATTTTPSAIIH
jgi:TM2 domain-containing membrane protein YozV